MLKSVRQESVLSLLQVRGSATVAEIADALGVSPATARRDIITLEEAGLLARTWGGAQLAAGVDDPFQEAVNRNGSAKQRIGRTAAACVHDGDTVILDIGTTVLYVAMALSTRHVNVVTASMPVFEYLRNQPTINLTLLGGRWSEPYQCFDGQPVIDALAHQQADVAFLGASGISERGRVRDTSYSQAAIKRSIVQAATTSHLLIDADKVPGRGEASPFDVGTIDQLITDAPLPPSLDQVCHAAGTTVVIA